jgi:release factor glutamine methyltransferase
MNFQQLVRETRAALSGAGSPGLEARLLTADLFGSDMACLYRHYQEEAGPGQVDRVRTLAARRARGEPVQHLLGEAWFYGRRFICDRRALVPRPETETLVDAVLRSDLPDNPGIVDVGTGSGVVGITLALALPGSSVTGTDVCPEAAALARENGVLHEARNFRVAVTDLVRGIPGEQHAVAANLPYIPTGDLPGLPPEVAFDPVTALDGGADGTNLIAALADTAGSVLRPGGLLALEIGPGQAGAVAGLLSDWRDVSVLEDLCGRPRVVTARRRA